MKKKTTSAYLKQLARGSMMGKYRNAISILLASELMVNTLSIFTAVSSNSYIGIVIGLIINFILILFASILNVGQCSFYLNIACGQTFQFSDLFTGFQTQPNKIILSQILIRLLTVLPLLPAAAVSILIFYTEQTPALLAADVLLLLLGSCVSWWISLRYSQVYYLLLDFPEYTIRDLLKISRKLMKKNTGRLLYLQLSFLPITFAGLLSFGIGFLFVKPYQNMTYTLFYLDLIKNS